MQKVMFTGDNLTDGERANLLNRGFQVDAYGMDLTKQQVIDYISQKKYDGYILGGDEIFDKETIEKLDNSLKTISFYGVGYESYIDTVACSKKGIVVTNTPRTNTNAVAEHTIALMLTATRNIAFNNTNTKNGAWQKEKVNDLSGLTIGIIGMGAIGSLVAKILHYSFGANLKYFNKTRKTDLEAELNMKYVSKEELFADSDIITLHCSINEETKYILNVNAFDKMKNGVIVIDTARAELIEPKALYTNLKNGKVRTVAFDGFYKEPINLQTDKDFGYFASFDDKQLIIGPHNAYFSNQALDKMKNMAIQNVIDVLSNKPCENVVNELSSMVRNENSYSSIITNDYNFYILETADYIGKIEDKVRTTLNPKNIELATTFDKLLECESLYNNDNKKVILAYSDLLGEGEDLELKKLSKIKNLHAICLGCTYLDRLDLDWCKKNNVIVTTLDDYRVEQRADLIFYLLQSVVGRISNLVKNPKENTHGYFPAFDLNNKKIGFIGYTDIARQLINKCKLYGMKVAYFSERKRVSDLEFNTLENLLSTSDIIVTVGYTKEEQYRLDKKLINKINAGACVISCEQGSQNINKDLFIELAEKGKIAGFGYTSTSDNMLDYKGNVFILRDQTWGSEESYSKLCNSWLNSVKSVIEGNAKDIAQL